MSLKTGSKQRGAICSFWFLNGHFSCRSPPAWLSHRRAHTLQIYGFKAPSLLFDNPFCFSPTELFLLEMERPLQWLTRVTLTSNTPVHPGYRQGWDGGTEGIPAWSSLIPTLPILRFWRAQTVFLDLRLAWVLGLITNVFFDRAILMYR